MANHPTKILDFRGFDSSIILISRGGILMSPGDFPESLSQAILVGIILVRRFGVLKLLKTQRLVQGGAKPAPRSAEAGSRAVRVGSRAVACHILV